MSSLPVAGGPPPLGPGAAARYRTGPYPTWLPHTVLAEQGLTVRARV